MEKPRSQTRISNCSKATRAYNRQKPESACKRFAHRETLASEGAATLMTEVSLLSCCLGLLCPVAIGFIFVYRRGEAWLRSTSVWKRGYAPEREDGACGPGTAHVLCNNPLDENVPPQLANLDAALGRALCIEGDACPAARRAGILR